MEIQFNTADPDRADQLEQQAWDLIEDAANGFTTMLGTISDEQLGALVREYIEEAQHGSWEGFTFTDLLGFHTVLGDMVRFYEASK